MAGVQVGEAEMRVRHLSRLAGAVFVAVAAFVTATAQAPARPAHADNDKGVDLVRPVLAPMLPGQRGWLAAVWTADRDVCNVRITMTGTGLTVGYPTNTASYSSFYVN